jgi:ubiquinone/menaquinone biosynthesis C-methylase UbiE
VSSLLDLGCGDGGLTMPVAEGIGVSMVYVIDLDEENRGKDESLYTNWTSMESFRYIRMLSSKNVLKETSWKYSE